MTRGAFIAFEGGEGAGKSTQARLLAQTLAERGIAAELTREPGGTPGAEAIRDLLLDPAGAGWEARAEALLFAAARSDHVERRIRPALEAGRWVICDRFIDSTRAYQGGGGGLSDGDIMALHEVGSGGLLPDLTVLLSLPAGDAAERLAARDIDGSDRIGGRELEYHARVAARFAQIAADEPERFAVIDGSGSADTVHARILQVIEPLLEARA